MYASDDEGSPAPASLRDPHGKRRAAADDAGLRTASRSRLPGGGALLDLEADGDGSGGRMRGASADASRVSAAALLDRLDLTVDDAGAPTGTDALADDPAFASPPPSPPPSGRSQPNGKALPKPKRAPSSSARTAAAGEPTASTSSRPALTLRDQEKGIDEVKKDNFSLKLKVREGGQG